MSEYAQNIIDESVKDQKLLNSKNRRELVMKYLNYYDGDNTYKYIKDRFKAKTFQEIPPSCYNLTKRFIERLSRLYTGRGCIRNVNDRYDKLISIKNAKFVLPL